ncbi:nuclear transport factor 2 family protein [uncultured Maribacter sp.]|uniref:nuclear transport factor 2 family protein n=1 Tax=uncultured Maribacter sp. TaxID=431308 RepID=UPI0026280B4B|nr:nuclear transport factor 2 family protein [uncultured Maribacter sp.]
MKKISFWIVFLFFLNAFAQETEGDKAKQTVLDFFEAFHAQDSIKMKKVVSPKVILQSIGKNRTGEIMVKTEKFHDLITSIVNIPDTLQFEEKLLSFRVNVDGAMANVWVPYEFWLNNTFHHCGVNSFQLLKKKDRWEIIYLIDTRRKNECKK